VARRLERQLDCCFWEPTAHFPITMKRAT